MIDRSADGGFSLSSHDRPRCCLPQAPVAARPLCVRVFLDSFVAGTERQLISIPPSRFASRQEFLQVIIWTGPLRPASRSHVFVDSSRLSLIALPGFTVSVSRTATCWISIRVREFSLQISEMISAVLDPWNSNEQRRQFLVHLDHNDVPIS